MAVDYSGYCRFIDHDLNEKCKKNATLSFGDQSHSRGDRIDFVEVLAAVPDEICVHGLEHPEEEYKYSSLEKLRHIGKSDVAKHLTLLAREAIIYVYDPNPAIQYFQNRPLYSTLAKTRSHDFADEWVKRELALCTARMLPEYWLSALPMDEDFYDLEECYGGGPLVLSAQALVGACNNNIANIRRRLLKSQHIHKEVLHARPNDPAFDQSKDEVLATLPVRDLVIGMAKQVMYDEGHSGDLDFIEAGRQIVNRRLSTFRRLFVVPEYVPGTISQKSSRENLHLQIADIAAGIARKTYIQFGPEGLFGEFSQVVINGTVCNRKIANSISKAEFSLHY